MGNIGSHVDLTSWRPGTSSKTSAGSGIPSSSARSSRPTKGRASHVCWWYGDLATAIQGDGNLPGRCIFPSKRLSAITGYKPTCGE